MKILYIEIEGYDNQTTSIFVNKVLAALGSPARPPAHLPAPTPEPERGATVARRSLPEPKAASAAGAKDEKQLGPVQAAILEALAKKPMTTPELQKLANIGVSVYSALDALRKRGLVATKATDDNAFRVNYLTPKS